MSKTSYVPVRFVGGPMGGTSREFAGEPKRSWTPKKGGLNGAYAFEWDRDNGGEKLRSGVYTWTQDVDAAPADGDAASALIEQVGPEKAAQRLNASGSSSVITSGEGTDDRKSQETGDNASARVALAEEKAAGKSDKAAQDSADARVAQAGEKDSKTSAAYDPDESGANTRRPTSSASKGSSSNPTSKSASK
jgi:hypothetical protein